MLNKIIAALTAALITIAYQAPAFANGCHASEFARQIAAQRHYERMKAAKYQSVAKPRQKVQQASVKKAAPVQVAAAEPAPVKETTVKQETKTVAEPATDTTAETASADTKKEVAVAEAGPTCTKFIPEVGTTVTVDCAAKN
jgi:uncharacterized membrane protein